MSFFIFALSNGISVLLSIFVINKREMHIAYEKNDFLTQK
ncbi:hypothetical protein OAL24_00346 [Oenococcus sicerae]|nr:hypothetical protein OAL24_00346 [Oenococcus sicerae]